MKHGAAAGSIDMFKYYQSELTKLMEGMTEQQLTEAWMTAKDWNNMGATPEAQARYVCVHHLVAVITHVSKKICHQGIPQGDARICRGNVEERGDPNGTTHRVQG